MLDYKFDLNNASIIKIRNALKKVSHKIYGNLYVDLNRLGFEYI